MADGDDSDEATDDGSEPNDGNGRDVVDLMVGATDDAREVVGEFLSTTAARP